MELIENMVASDQAILRDRSYMPTKRSLLELGTQDATLAQNKLLMRQIEALTETLSKLPQQVKAVSSSHSSVLQVEGFPTCGGTHEPGQCETRSHQKSTDAAIRNLEVQMGQLAQDKAERPTRTFGANTEKNPKEECKAVLTRGQKKAQEEGKVEEEDRPEEERTETPEGRIEEEEKVASPACFVPMSRPTCQVPKGFFLWAYSYDHEGLLDHWPPCSR
ncbi:hypothetical protein HKD37_14G041018 [Glycine soja]